MLAVYSTEAKGYGIPFSKKALNYAKAVTCLRLIAFVQVRYADTLYIHIFLLIKYQYHLNCGNFTS